MTIIKTISEDQLDSLRPEVFEAYTKLIDALRFRMRLRHSVCCVSQGLCIVRCENA
jgi:hypothetical protein